MTHDELDVVSKRDSDVDLIINTLNYRISVMKEDICTELDFKFKDKLFKNIFWVLVGMWIMHSTTLIVGVI